MSCDSFPMCEALRSSRPEGDIDVYFARPGTRLRAISKHGETELPWGRREDEPGQLPVGACIAHGSITRGALNRFHPQFAKIEVRAFCVLDRRGKPVWHDVVQRYWVLGVTLRVAEEQRVYVVATPASGNESHAWPWVEMTERLPALP